jgi:hypothetical protein
MDDERQVIDGTVIALTSGMRPGFDFFHGEKKCHCFDAGGTQDFSHLRPGERIVIEGRWSSAVIGVFESDTVRAKYPS